MPSSAASSLLVISERWHVEALATPSCPGVLLCRSKAVLWTGVFLHRASFVPRPIWYSRPFFFVFFWHLKRYLSPDRDSSYTHTSTPLLSVPLLSGLCCEVAIHLTHLECDRWQHTEVKMNASHKRRWLEMPYGEGKERMTEKNIYIFFCCCVFQFRQFSDRDFTTEKFWDSRQRLWEDDRWLQISG